VFEKSCKFCLLSVNDTDLHFPNGGQNFSWVTKFPVGNCQTGLGESQEMDTAEVSKLVNSSIVPNSVSIAVKEIYAKTYLIYILFHLLILIHLPENVYSRIIQPYVRF
jgi:hypothetical protein